MNTPFTPPPPPDDGSRPVEQNAGNHPDARQFFRDLYAGMPAVPAWQYERDVKTFEEKHGGTAGYTREQLTEAVKAERAAAREQRQGTDPKASPPTKGAPPTNNPWVWEKWLLGIGFGTFILAAIALAYFAVSIQKLTTWEELRPYTIGLTSTGGLLFLLTFGMRAAHVALGSHWVGKMVTIVLAVLFLFVVLAIVIWFVVLVFRDAGILPKPVAERVPPAALPAKIDCGEPVESCYSLPDDLLTTPGTKEKPLIVMETLERGAWQRLKAKPEEVTLCWYVTPSYDTGASAATLQACFGTSAPAVVHAFMVVDDGSPKPFALPETETQPRESERWFVMPESRHRTRLLVLVAMKWESYDKIRGNTKFELKTQRP